MKNPIVDLTDNEVNAAIGCLQGYAVERDCDDFIVRGPGGLPISWQPCTDPYDFDEVIDKWRHGEGFDFFIELSPAEVRVAVVYMSRSAYGRALTHNRAVLNALLAFHFDSEIDLP